MAELPEDFSEPPGEWVPGILLAGDDLPANAFNPFGAAELSDVLRWIADGWEGNRPYFDLTVGTYSSVLGPSPDDMREPDLADDARHYLKTSARWNKARRNAFLDGVMLGLRAGFMEVVRRFDDDVRRATRQRTTAPAKARAVGEPKKAAHFAKQDADIAEAVRTHRQSNKGCGQIEAYKAVGPRFGLRWRGVQQAFLRHEGRARSGQ